ncbi:MAG: racemase [Spirochaetaceae bacterium]|nr:MAG: racemase [Spirochaetaceae bacterium]
MKITGIIAHLLDSQTKYPFDWQVDRPGSDDGRGLNRSYSCLLRILTDDGVEGHGLVPSRGRATIDVVERRFGEVLIGHDPLNSEFLWERMWDIDRLEEFPIYAQGIADLALWDLKGKVANLPVYKLAGGYRDEIPAYASTTSFDTEQEYFEVIDAALEEGYSSIKLHLRYRDVKINAKLCKAIRKHVGDDVELTLDASAMWDYTDSLWFGRRLEELEFLWYEEPMREFDLESYAKLCSDLDIPVLAAETPDGVHWNAGEFIRRGACDIMRTSTHYKAGITGGLKVAHLAESYGMYAEVHGGGLANLHLGLAIPNNRYYEDLVISPKQVRDTASRGVPLKNGMVRVPEGSVGLGLDLDIAEIEKNAVTTVRLPAK